MTKPAVLVHAWMSASEMVAACGLSPLIVDVDLQRLQPRQRAAVHRDDAQHQDLAPQGGIRRMNIHEERAWKLLIELGAREFMLGGKHALDLKPIRATTEKKLRLLVQAVLQVVGRSNANRRHVDQSGCPVYVVTDFYTVNSHDRDRHEPERLALVAKARKAREGDQ